MWGRKDLQHFMFCWFPPKTIKFFFGKPWRWRILYHLISYETTQQIQMCFFQDLDDGDLGGELVRETQDERDEMMGPKAFGHVKLVQVIPDKTQQVIFQDRPAWSQKTGRFSDHLWYTVDDSVYMRLQPPLLEGFERKFLSARNFSINLPTHHISCEIIQQNAGLATAQHFGKDRWLQHLCGST